MNFGDTTFSELPMASTKEMYNLIKADDLDYSIEGKCVSFMIRTDEVTSNTQFFSGNAVLWFKTSLKKIEYVKFLNNAT